MAELAEENQNERGGARHGTTTVVGKEERTGIDASLTLAPGGKSRLNRAPMPRTGLQGSFTANGWSTGNTELTAAVTLLVDRSAPVKCIGFRDGLHSVYCLTFYILT